MNYEIVELPQRTIMGLFTRTSNSSPEEGAVIGALWQRFMEDGMEKSVPEPVCAPYGCFGLYYDYGMEDMSYELLIGCETGASQPAGEMKSVTIPAGRYAKFTIRGGDVVASVQEAWAAIWADEELMAKRAFTVDFEAYLPGEDMSCADIDVMVALR